MRVFYIKYPLQKDYIYKIRCWIKYPQNNIDELSARINNFAINCYFNVERNIYPSLEILMEKIVKEFNNELAAIEITDIYGSGLVEYLEWP